MAFIAPSRRLRRTPFSAGAETAVVKGDTVYNRMLPPSVVKADGMPNDPVAVKLIDDRYWISIADSDLPSWVKGIVHGVLLQVRAGCRNLIERTESGLLSCGNDRTRGNTPHEAGLARFCSAQIAIGCVGRDAPLRVTKECPVKQIRPIEISGDALPPRERAWPITAGDRTIGQVTSAPWSLDFQWNVAIGMVKMRHRDAGTEIAVNAPVGPRMAIIQKTFWN